MNANQPPPEQPEASALALAIATKLNAAFNLYAWEDSKREAAEIVSEGIADLERQLAAVRCELASARGALEHVQRLCKDDSMARFRTPLELECYRLASNALHRLDAAMTGSATGKAGE